MKHDLRPVSFEQGQQAFGAEVQVEERELLAVAARLGQIRDAAGRQVVDADHAVALGQQPIREMRADEPGAPGHQGGRHAVNLRFGSAPMSSDVRSPRESLADPAHAIIAALSVHRSNGGISTRSPAVFPLSSIRSRRRLFATTPPPSRTVSTPRTVAAAMVLLT